jgi:predicted enzyme related to lactoylglutathione lyase
MAGSDGPAGDGGVEAALAKHGKISYIEIPAVDIQRSANFYQRVFGWALRGDPAFPGFVDASGSLIGHWIVGRPVAREPGILPFVYVDNVDEVLATAVSEGAEVVRDPYAEGDLRVATLRDPAGNVIGIWQQPG